MNRFANPSECWKEAALCRTQGAPDEQLRALYISMAGCGRNSLHIGNGFSLNAEQAYSV
jgi:hypothetical protein